MSESKTPRTDAHFKDICFSQRDVEFARTLEHELNEANASNLTLQRSSLDLCQERDRLKSEVDTSRRHLEDSRFAHKATRLRLEQELYQWHEVADGLAKEHGPYLSKAINEYYKLTDWIVPGYNKLKGEK